MHGVRDAPSAVQLRGRPDAWPEGLAAGMAGDEVGFGDEEGAGDAGASARKRAMGAMTMRCWRGQGPRGRGRRSLVLVVVMVG